MPSYKPYHPEQAPWLPAHAKDVLGESHLCFLVHDVVEQMEELQDDPDRQRVRIG